MQKKLIVAAVAAAIAAPAFAQSAVTISGTMRMGMEQWKRQDLSGETRFTDQSSLIAFSGVEDLGGGLKAFFRIESRLSNDQAPDARNVGINGWSLGNSGVGLEGGFGKITLGRWDLHYGELAGNIELGGGAGYRVFSLQNLAGHGIMSQVQGTALARTTRSNNVLMYDTPKMGGFVGRLAYSTNPGGNEGCVGVAAGNVGATGCNPNPNVTGGTTNNPSKNGAWNAKVAYANGPLGVGYSYWNWKYEQTVRDNAAVGAVVAERGDSLWASYLFGGLKVGLGWNKSRVDYATALGNATTGDMKRTAWMIPVAYQMGNHGFYFTYAVARDASGSIAQVANAIGATTTGGNTGAKFWRLGYDYALSKRTAVGVQYAKLDNEACAAYNMFNSGATGVNGASNGVGTGTNSCNGAAGGATAAKDQTQMYLGVNHSF